jgi:zinc/manganese transport system permease protein
VIDSVLGPFAEFSFLRRALVGCLALSVSAAPLGMFLMLRRMSLTGDVLTHGILPGVAVAFLVGGLSVVSLAIGGIAGGLLVALLAGALSRATGGREDASLAAVYLVALAFGVALVSMAADSVDVMALLFGSVLGVDDAALLLMCGVATLTLVTLAFAWRPLVLECFDPDFAAAEGARGGLWHLLFLALVVVNVVAAVGALGTLMAVGLLLLPAIAARHWSTEVSGIAKVAVGIAALSSFTGLLLSYHADTPSGPAIVLTAGGAWVASVTMGPVDSLAARFWRRRHLAG